MGLWRAFRSDKAEREAMRAQKLDAKRIAEREARGMFNHDVDPQYVPPPAWEPDRAYETEAQRAARWGPDYIG
jgi:hypothetical protein